MIGRNEQTSVTSAPAELTLTALIRARQCEHVAAEIGVRPEPAFTVGLISVVGAFTGMPTEEASLPLTAEVVWAITRQTGLLGDMLAAVLCCERNRLSTACHSRRHLHLHLPGRDRPVGEHLDARLDLDQRGEVGRTAPLRRR